MKDIDIIGAGRARAIEVVPIFLDAVRWCLHPHSLNLRELIKKHSVEHPEWQDEEIGFAAERIVHRICMGYEWYEIPPKFFVPINNREMNEICGREPYSGPYRYKKSLSLLVALGVVEVNPHYSNGGGDFKAFPKSFRFCHPYRFENRYGKTRQPQHGKWTRKDKSEVANAVQVATFQNIKRLSLDVPQIESLLKSADLPPARWIGIHSGANKLWRGVVDLRAGKKQSRLYHTVNCAPRELRAALRLDGEPLVELDVKSCQPVLLLLKCPQAEREAYKEALAADIYRLGGLKRERAKQQFLWFAFGKYTENRFARAMKARFPMLTQAILEYPDSLSADLQNEEAKICIYGVGEKLMRERIFNVSIHDGILVRRTDVERATEILRAEFRERIPDFEVQIGITDHGKRL